MSTSSTRRHTKLTLEEKRERQRGYVKNSYYRVLNTMRTLRQEVAQLTDDYNRVVAIKSEEYKHENLTIQSEEDIITNNNDIVCPIVEGTKDSVKQFILNPNSKILKTLRRKYTELAIERSILERDNEHYRDQLQKFNEHQDKLSRVLSQHQQLFQQLSSIQEEYILPKLKRFVTSDEALILAAKSYHDHIRRFHNFKVLEASGACVFGWRDRWKQDGECFIVSIRKTFRHTSATHLGYEKWSVDTAADYYRRLLPLQIDMQVHTLQHIDENSVILYAIIIKPELKSSYRSVFLMTRFQTEDGLMILSRSIDHHYYLDKIYDLSEYDINEWLPIFGWTIYNDVPDSDDCEVDFGGVLMPMYGEPARGSSEWMMSIILMAVRLESFLQGSIFSLCND